MLADLPGLDYRIILIVIWKLIIIIQISSSAGTDTGSLKDLRDRYPTPRFLTTKTNITRFVGEIALLNCSIVNLGTRTVVWRRIEEISPLTVGTYTYVKDNSITVEHKQGTPGWNLKITNVTMEHDGTYECQVSTKNKNFRKYFYLKILKRQDTDNTELKQEIHLFGPELVEKGQQLSLSCNATGVDTPPDDLDWFRNGYKVVTNFDEGVFMDKTVRLSTKTISSTLHITRAKMTDSGIYTCRTSDLQVLSTNVLVLSADSDQHKRGWKSTSKDSQSVTEKSEGLNKCSINTLTLSTVLISILNYHIFLRTFIL